MLAEYQIIANNHAQRLVLDVQKWVNANLFSDFTVSAKFDWSYSRRSSRGGIYKDGPGINMAMIPAMPANNGLVFRFYEYASYDSDKIIGGFYSTKATDKLEAIVLHEIAHAVQFFSYKKQNFRCTPHGPTFKHYYKLLREQFLNYKLPEQTPLKDQYDQLFNSIKTTIKTY